MIKEASSSPESSSGSMAPGQHAFEEELGEKGGGIPAKINSGG
jgi:hypothetical protein